LALFDQVLLQHRPDFCVGSLEVVATRTFVPHFQHASVLVLSLTFAFAVNAQDALTVCAFEFELIHPFALLLIQGLEFVRWHLSAVGANQVFWIHEPGLLLTQAKHFIASVTHDGL